MIRVEAAIQAARSVAWSLVAVATWAAAPATTPTTPSAQSIHLELTTSGNCPTRAFGTSALQAAAATSRASRCADSIAPWIQA